MVHNQAYTCLLYTSVADGGGRHYVVKVLCEILTAAHQILHILDGMLVAHSQTAGPPFHFQPISQIGGKDVYQRQQ